MNHWVVIFNDAPEMLERRKTHFEKHVAYLTSQPEIFLDGGSLAEAQDSDPTGGIWILRATDRDEIVRLIEADPMYSPELRCYDIFRLGNGSTFPNRGDAKCLRGQTEQYGKLGVCSCLTVPTQANFLRNLTSSGRELTSRADHSAAGRLIASSRKSSKTAKTVERFSR